MRQGCQEPPHLHEDDGARRLLALLHEPNADTKVGRVYVPVFLLPHHADVRREVNPLRRNPLPAREQDLRPNPRRESQRRLILVREQLDFAMPVGPMECVDRVLPAFPGHLQRLAVEASGQGFVDGHAINGDLMCTTLAERVLAGISALHLVLAQRDLTKPEGKTQTSMRRLYSHARQIPLMGPRHCLRRGCE